MRLHLGTLLLSTIIALTLWGMAHGTSSIERSVDIPVIFDDVPDELVITGRSADAVNVRVLGSRAALRNVNPARLEYRIDVSDAKPGPGIYEVDVSRIGDELPRGARIVSRSPSSIEVDMERRGRKALRIRPDVVGQPADGFRITAIALEPQRVWVTGARGDVLRLSEVVTETVDVTGISASLEREVSLSLGSDHVWREENGKVVLRLQVEPIPESEGADAASGGAA